MQYSLQMMTGKLESKGSIIECYFPSYSLIGNLYAN